MNFEYSIWNMTDGWVPMEGVTTAEQANRRIKNMGPYAEELRLRDADTKEEYKRGRKP
jgi:hypothetical protein